MKSISSLSRLSNIFVTIIDRLWRYQATLRWLVSLALTNSARRFIVSSVLSLISVALQILPILIVVRIIGIIETQGNFVLPKSEYLAKIIPDIDPVYISVLMVAIVVLLVILAGYAKYLARIIALNIEKQITSLLVETLIEGLSCLTNSYKRWQFFDNFNQRDIMRDTSASTRFCGIAIRLLLYKIIEIFYLIAGLAILLVISPLAFSALVVVAILGTLISYPLNLEAVQLAHSLENMAGERGQMIQHRLQTAMDNKLTSNINQFSVEKQIQIESDFLNVFMGRWKILESSHFAFSSFFGVILGLFLWVLISSDAKEFLSYGNLILLFFAFRYTFIGYQGLITLITTINRFLPGIVRVKKMTEHLEKICQDKTPIKDSRMLKPGANIAWHIKTKISPSKSGKIHAGEIHLIMGHHTKPEDLIAQLLSILSDKHYEFANACDFGLASYEKFDQHDAIVGIYPVTSAVSAVEDNLPLLDTINWIIDVLSELEIDISQEQVIKFLGEEDNLNLVHLALIRQLAAIHKQIMSGSGIVIINCKDAFNLVAKTPLIDILKRRMQDHIVIIFSSWQIFSPEFDVKDFNWIFVSEGSEITFASPGSKLSPRLWEVAENQYNSKKSTPAASAMDIELM